MANLVNKIEKIPPLKLLYAIIGINILSFIFVSILDPTLIYHLALSSQFSVATPLQLFTSMFVHPTFTHIFFNMFGLYMFGNLVAPRLGSFKFLMTFLIAGVTGNLIWLFANLGEHYELVGASGALFGIMAAAGLLMPELRVMLLIPPMPVKMKTLVIVFGLVEVLFTFMDNYDNVANIAHVGGLIGGYIAIRYVFSLSKWDFFEFLFGTKFKSKKKGKKVKMPKGWSFTEPKQANPKPRKNTVKNESSSSKKNRNSERVKKNMVYDDISVMDTAVHIQHKDVDDILDKVAKTGYHQLSSEEAEILRKARERFKKK